VSIALRALDYGRRESDTSTGRASIAAERFNPLIKIVSGRRHHYFAREQNCCGVQGNSRMIEEPYRWVEAIANRREYIEAQACARQFRSRRSVIVTAILFSHRRPETRPEDF